MGILMKNILDSLHHKRNDKKLFGIALLGAGLVSGTLSLWIGLRQSVWFDEAYSIMIAKQPVGEIIRLVGLDTHPPLYYLLLKGWASVFGWSEFALRSLSLTALVLTVVVAGLLVRKMFGARIAIGSVLLVAIAPLLLRYGFEIRMYSVGMLIGVIATYALVIASKREKGYRRWLILYAVLVAIGMYTMYSLAFLWVAHVVWILYIHRAHKHPLGHLTEWVGAYSGAVVLFLPWLATFFSQLGNGALAPIGQPLNFENILGIASFNVLYRPLHEVNALLTIVFASALVIIGYAVVCAFRTARRERTELTLLAMSIGVPIAVLVLVSIGTSMYVERYLSFAAVYAVLLCSVALTMLLINQQTVKVKISVGVVYAAFLLGCLQLAGVGNLNYQRAETPTVKRAVQAIECYPNERVLAADPYVAIELAYYVTDCPIYFVSEHDVLGGGYAPLSGSPYQVKDIQQLSGERFIYVYYGDGEPLLWSGCTALKREIHGALTVAHLQCD